jgi:CBS domain-containing protein
MKVSDIMTSGVDFIKPTDTVKDAAVHMRDRNIGIIPVFEGENPVGLITDRDIALRVIAEGRDPFTTRVFDVMTHEIIFCHDTMDVEEAAHIMEQRKIRRLLVKNRDGHVVGVLSLGDIATSMTRELTGEIFQEVVGVAFPER